MKRFKVGVYCRLSHEDFASNKDKAMSESIENQKLLITSYIDKHFDEFEMTKIYIDDGISGMTFERASFLQMMEDAKGGIINAIIVKDLSRIGREQVETLNLIKKEFILHDIRFIALTDDYDSYNPAKSDGLSTSVKLLLNDYYCADISKKVRGAQKAKRESGDFIGSHAPYGYKKSLDNHNRLEIDEEAATVVKKIFNMYIGGEGKESIARHLNNELIPNPTEYKRKVLAQKYFNGNKLSSTNYWTYSTINHILKNAVYAGHTVQHKSEIKAYNIRKKVAVPKEKWCIVENTHEAIICKNDFQLVQNMLTAKRRQIDFNSNISKYAGIFYCSECGRRMNKFLSKPRKDSSRYVSFKCGSYSMFGKEVCSIHSIKESELDEILLEEIQKIIRKALDIEAYEYIKSKKLNQLNINCHNKIQQLKAEIIKCGKKREIMLKHLAEMIISSEDFKSFDLQNKKELEKLKNQIKALEVKLKEKQKQTGEYDSWLENLLKYKNLKEINREVIINFVDKIYISEDKNGDNKKIEIKFKFKEP